MEKQRKLREDELILEDEFWEEETEKEELARKEMEKEDKFWEEEDDE